MNGTSPLMLLSYSISDRLKSQGGFKEAPFLFRTRVIVLQISFGQSPVIFQTQVTFSGQADFCVSLVILSIPQPGRKLEPSSYTSWRSEFF